MSKNNIVNPGQYKVAGRERQGEDVVHDREKAKASVTEHDEREQAKRRKRTGGIANQQKTLARPPTKVRGFRNVLP